MNAQRTPDPWWADWSGIMADVAAHLSARQEAARCRQRASKVAATDSDRGRQLLQDALVAQRRANSAAESVRYCAYATEKEARRIAKASGSAA